jgi:hypothetical protein
MVDAVADEHHLMTALIRQYYDVASTDRAAERHLVFGGRQLIGLLLEIQGVRKHMALQLAHIQTRLPNSRPWSSPSRRPFGANGRVIYRASRCPAWFLPIGNRFAAIPACSLPRINGHKELS